MNFKHKIIASTITLIGIIVLLVILTPALNMWGTYPERSRSSCETKLTSLFNAIVEYTKMHGGELPDKNSWCDNIYDNLKTSDDKMKIFICISDRSGTGNHSSYSMNQYLSQKDLAQISGDTVLLYESNAGWNSSGGLEGMTFSNHKHLLEKKRCGVLFVNGKVLHVYENDIHNLRWKP